MMRIMDLMLTLPLIGKQKPPTGMFYGNWDAAVEKTQ
jgi:hypothetical protein